MAIFIEELIEENLHLKYPWAHSIEIDHVTDSYYVATLAFWMDDGIEVGVSVNDEEEITAIEEL